MTYGYLTRVLLHFNAEAFNRYLRFGNSIFREDVTRREAYEYFNETQIFCYVQWESNEFGTSFWRLSVLQAATRDKPAFRSPGIDPGANILLDVKGVDRVRKAYSLIDEIEGLGIDAADVSPEYYLFAHQMLNTGLPIRPYTQQQHQAYLNAKKLADKEVRQCDECH